jgi:hypothetical protein
MTPDLGNIDVGLLDTLARLEADQRSIRALAEKAAWHRDKVFEVYSRIVRDYAARVNGVEEQVSAVRLRVREDLRSLDALTSAAATRRSARVGLGERVSPRSASFAREFRNSRKAERTIANGQEFETVKARGQH